MNRTLMESEPMIPNKHRLVQIAAATLFLAAQAAGATEALAPPAGVPPVPDARNLYSETGADKLRPEVAARNSDFVNYANANARATELVNEELRNDPSIYPTAETKARQRADRSVLILPVPLSTAGRERVAGHLIAVLERAQDVVLARR